MSDFELLYASDGVYPKRGQMIIVDEQREYPPGHYRMRNVKIDDVQFFDFDSKFGKPVTVVPGDYDETPRIEVVKVAPPEKLREDIVSLEEFQPQDNMFPSHDQVRYSSRTSRPNVDSTIFGSISSITSSRSSS